MIELETTADGVLLPIIAQPKARRSGLAGEHAGRLKVAVTEAPEKGKANKALVKAVAAALGLKRSQVEIVAGETSSRKRMLLRGTVMEHIRRRLDEKLSGR